MYSCQKCSLMTNQLNGLLSRHATKHISIDYSREQYKLDVLTANGRPPSYCKICNKQTHIPKGESEYPNYCKDCYITLLKSKIGNSNSNWGGGKTVVTCANCNKKRETYSSQADGERVFCSVSCSTKFYCKVENMSLAKKIFFLQSRSKKEGNCYQLIKQIFPDTIYSYHLGYYNFDIFVPSQNLLIEFDGTYWHSLAKTIINDRRKNTYILNNHPNLRLIRIAEKKWDLVDDKIAYLVDLFA